MKAGDTFRREGMGENHLWVIISDPERDPNHVVVVNFTSWRSGADPACEVNAGEHPFITHRTFAYYREARIYRREQLANLRYPASAPVSPALLQRLRAGAAVSDFIPLRCRRILEAQGLIDPAD